MLSKAERGDELIDPANRARAEIVEGGLQDGCFESGNGSFAENCSHGVSRSGEMEEGAMEDREKEGVAEVSEGELLLEIVRRVFEKKGRIEALLRVCEYEKREAGGASLLIGKKDAWRLRHCSVEEMALWSEGLENTGWAKWNSRSSALRPARWEAIEEMQERTCLRWGREAGSETESEVRDGRELVLLTTLRAFSGRKKGRTGRGGKSLGRKERRYERV